MIQEEFARSLAVFGLAHTIRLLVVQAQLTRLHKGNSGFMNEARYVPHPSFHEGQAGPSLWFIRDTLAQTTHEAGTVEWSNDVLVRDKNNRKRSFKTLRAALKAVDQLNGRD
jgi:hypothetical protein